MTIQAARKTFASFDYLLFSAVCALVAIGITFIYSASASSGQWGEISRPRDFAMLQLRWAIIAVGIFFAILVPRYTRVKSASFAFYFVCLILLVAVLFIGKGPERSDVRRWIEIGFGGFRIADFQPSQLMQVALVLVLAWYLMYRRPPSLLDCMVVFIAAGIPMVLVLKEPDLGTALLFAPLPFIMLYAAGAPARYLMTFFAAGLCALPLFWDFLMKDYQKVRFLAWLEPMSYYQKEGWQYVQSRIAVGSGGILGRGLGRGAQNSLNYLSERHTDFIFSVIMEEKGFIGAICIVSLYLVVFLCGLGIAARTREPYGRLVVVGMVSLLATQVFVNIGMNIGLMPITGLTLPFISYGGSSLLASFIGLAIMMNVAVHPVLVLSKEGV